MRPNMNGDWPSLGGRIMRMPFSLTALVLSTFTSLGLGGAALGIVVPTVVGAIQIGLSIGLSYLANSVFGPKAPKPEDVQQSTRQPTQPRVRHYGRVKVSGPWVFAESKGGNFYKLLAIGVGPIDGIENYWVDDEGVNLDSTGDVTSGAVAGHCNIQTRLGAATETSYSILTERFPEWTTAHRGDGVASLCAIQRAVEDKDYLSTFPNGINTNYRLVLRGAIVTHPVTGVDAWNDNAAAVIRDYITHAEGMRLPASIIATPLAAAGWAAAYNRAADIITTKEGTEARYRLWGSYTLEERPADVVGRMLNCCDGRLVPTPDGGLTLDIGQWAEPTVTLDNDSITGFSEVGRGRDILSTANTIRAKYLDPGQDYQAADADPWVDATDVSARGEIASDMEFPMAPSHSQARRLMKLAAFRANPTWVGTFQCNLKALAAFGERFVRVNLPALGINSVFEVQDFRFDIGEGGILRGVTLQVQSMPEAAYQWNAAEEEGDAPEYDESEVDNSVPKPDAPDVDFIAGPIARLSFSPAPSAILHIEARGRATADTAWIDIPVTAGATTADSWALSAATEYEFQIRYVTEKGRDGDWSDSTTITTPA